MTILPVLIPLFLSATRTKNIINFDEKTSSSFQYMVSEKSD